MRLQSWQSVHGAVTDRVWQYWQFSVKTIPSTSAILVIADRALRLMVEGFALFTLNSVFLH
jgi:hypothetical protein